MYPPGMQDDQTEAQAHAEHGGESRDWDRRMTRGHAQGAAVLAIVCDSCVRLA